MQIREDIQTIIQKVEINHDVEVPVETIFLRSFSFPITEMGELEQVDSYLQNEDNFKQAVSFIWISNIFLSLLLCNVNNIFYT